MKAILICLFLGGFMPSPSIATAETPKAVTARPSEHFREEHKEIKTHLRHVEEWTGELNRTKAGEQKKSMEKIVAFFKEHIKPHAQWEERKLYPAVDKRASQGPGLFTTTMRYEHKIVGRWTEELEKMAQSKSPDITKFVRKTDQLLGLITAHFEEEEEVLLPVLDRSMSIEEFKKEILSEEKH